MCIYLSNVHFGVALPVILISVAAVAVYLFAVIVPIIYDFCPYETALSMLLRSWVGPWARAWFMLWHAAPPPDKPSFIVPVDELTSRALSWLISYCENTRAVDLALKSIAGADRTLPCGRLLECNTVGIIIQRINDCFTAFKLSMDKDLALLGEKSPESYDSVVVYARSLNVLFSRSVMHTHMYDERVRVGRQYREALLQFYGW